MHPLYRLKQPVVLFVQSICAMLILLGTVGDVWIAGLIYRIPVFFLGSLTSVVITVDHFNGLFRRSLFADLSFKLKRLSMGPAPFMYWNGCMAIALFWLLLYRWYFTFGFLAAYQISCLEMRYLCAEEVGARRERRARAAWDRAFRRSLDCQRRLLTRDPGTAGGADGKP